MEAVLPAELRELPFELGKVDAILDGVPFRSRLTARTLASGKPLRDRRRSVGKRVRAISAARVRAREMLGTIDRLRSEIAERAKQTLGEARTLLNTSRCELAAGARAGGGLVDRLERELEAAEQIVAQTDLRLAGQRTIPDRRVSLVDSDARPIRRGSPRRPTEFGYKALLADTAEGFVIADIPERGAPTDGSLLEAAISKATRTGMQLRSVYADRGFGTSTADAALAQHRIRDPVIPRQQRAAAIEHTRSWRRRYRFLNGLEGRISQLKRKGLRRTRLRSLEGAQTWMRRARPVSGWCARRQRRVSGCSWSRPARPRVRLLIGSRPTSATPICWCGC
ncbi:MAG: hypothetical protein M3Q31_03620 [Actinomycetota bacterium]|nr:hypothetical protein [Actinomycetota bacterium]